MAIVGDSSDNIPGVPKVGPKTAVKWLKEFKNLKGIIKNADSLTGVVGQNFRDSIPDLDRNIELVTLKRDVDIGVSLESLLKAKEDQGELNKLFTSLEFKTWIKSSSDSSDEKPKNTITNKEYQSVLKEKELIAWAKKIEKCKAFAIDTETSSLDTMTADLIGISLACDEGEGCYIPINHSYEGMPTQLSIDLIQIILGSVISKNQNKLGGQNLKFDLPMLNRH